VTRLPVDRAVLDAVRNFYAAGLNYRAHIEWANRHHGGKYAVPAQADIGYRSPNALIANGEQIVIPADAPGPIEFEGELVAVIGRPAKNVPEQRALDYVAGYTLGNDVSERTWQRSDRHPVAREEFRHLQADGPGDRKRDRSDGAGDRSPDQRPHRIELFDA